LRKLEASQGGFLKADNPALAAAALQDRLKRLIARTGGTLKSVQVLAPEADGGYRRVSMDVMVTAEIGPLKDMLYDLETGVPYLFVDELDIRRLAVRVFTARGKADAAPAEEQVQVRFKLSGFMRGGST
jgi:general secretion pathway protein M